MAPRHPPLLPSPEAVRSAGEAGPTRVRGAGCPQPQAPSSTLSFDSIYLVTPGQCTCAGCTCAVWFLGADPWGLSCSSWSPGHPHPYTHSTRATCRTCLGASCPIRQPFQVARQGGVSSSQHPSPSPTPLASGNGGSLVLSHLSQFAAPQLLSTTWVSRHSGS